MTYQPYNWKSPVTRKKDSTLLTEMIGKKFDKVYFTQSVLIFRSGNLAVGIYDMDYRGQVIKGNLKDLQGKIILSAFYIKELEEENFQYDYIKYKYTYTFQVENIEVKVQWFSIQDDYSLGYTQHNFVKQYNKNFYTYIEFINEWKLNGTWEDDF